MIKCREGVLSFLYCTGPVSALGSIVIINDNPAKFVQGSEKFFSSVGRGSLDMWQAVLCKSPRCRQVAPRTRHALYRQTQNREKNAGPHQGNRRFWRMYGLAAVQRCFATELCAWFLQNTKQAYQGTPSYHGGATSLPLRQRTRRCD